MIRQIIIGEEASGKTFLYAVPSVKRFNGKVIYITDAKQDIEGVIDTEIEGLSSVKQFDKIQIDINDVLCENKLECVEKKELLYEFLKKHLKDKNTLLVLDAASFMSELLTNLSGLLKLSNIIIILNSIVQLGNKNELELLEKIDMIEGSLKEKWDVIFTHVSQYTKTILL